MTCTGTHTITQADVDAGHFDDVACVNGAPAAQQCAPDTVTAQQTRTLAITKSADTASYDHVGQVITYTIVATNTGNVTQTITVTDTPPLDGFTCSPTNGSAVAPSGTMTCTGTHTVTQADLDAGHFSDQACANAPGAPQACASKDIPGKPSQVSQITPTGTTCSQFTGNTADTLSTLNYAVKNGLTASVSPGVFFYWVKVTAVAGSNTFTINQAITTGNFDSNFFNQASGSFVYTSGCVKVNSTITTSNGVTTVQFNASSAGTYVIGIKYDSKSVEGKSAPSPGTTVHYNFSTSSTPGSTSGIDLVKK